MLTTHSHYSDYLSIAKHISEILLTRKPEEIDLDCRREAFDFLASALLGSQFSPVARHLSDFVIAKSILLNVFGAISPTRRLLDDKEIQVHLLVFQGVLLRRSMIELELMQKFFAEFARRGEAEMHQRNMEKCDRV